ncbi:helix-turn-helix transcriptional regulator [Mesorhizobium sp. B2-4-17]|nr:helix-turn-helix transcriptional regulator [Mesorhizobium sp. B2-4-17]
MAGKSQVQVPQALRSTAPTVLSLTVNDIEVTRTFQGDRDPGRSEPVPRSGAFSVIVQLRDFERHRLWRGSELVFDGAHQCGDLAITDLRDQWRCEHLSPFDNVRFRIPFASLKSFAEDVGRPEYQALSCPPGTRDDVMLGLARALLPSLDHPQKAHRLFLEQVNLAMLAHLTQAYGGLHFPCSKKGVLAPWQEKRAAEFLVAHASEPFSMVELATACKLSRSYFIKAFKESFGRTPHRWLTEYRVARAKDLLGLDMPIAEIAIACGFADQSHMTRVFAELVGVSPGRYRRGA